MKSSKNDIKPHASLDGFQPTSRQLVTEPRNWVKADASLGSTIITSKRFLGGNPETSKISARQSGYHAI